MTARLHEQLVSSDPSYANDIAVLDNNAPQPYEKAQKRLSDNRFWAGALDYCVKDYASRGYTHLWFLNNDIFFVSSPPVVHRCWARMQYLEKQGARVGVYSPSFTANPYHPHMVTSSRGGFSEVAYVDGIAPLIRLDCIRDIGGLDVGDNDIGYGVDVWMSLRASRKGWSVVVDHEVVARHRYHATSRSFDGFMERAAALENDYMLSRLGDDYRLKLRMLAQK
ncbi:glycosyltransferase family 2 protein [Desulfoplanes sp.]